MDGRELLQCLDVPEPRHRSFSSPERLVRVFGSIVEPPPTLLAIRNADSIIAVLYDRSQSVTTLPGRP